MKNLEEIINEENIYENIKENIKRTAEPIDPPEKSTTL